jgi:hypothetical protein
LIVVDAIAAGVKHVLAQHWLAFSAETKGADLYLVAASRRHCE